MKNFEFVTNAIGLIEIKYASNHNKRFPVNSGLNFAAYETIEMAKLALQNYLNI